MKFYEEEVISIPASWGTDGVAKYGVYSCPLKKRYNYKKSLYIAFRPAGGVVKTLYKLRDRYELMPDSAMIRNRDMDAKDKRAILGYLKDPKYKDVCSENETMQFFVLDMKHVIQLPRGGAKSAGRSPRGIVYYFLSDMLNSARCKGLLPVRITERIMDMHKTVLICTLAMAFVCSAANQRETPLVLSSQMRTSDPAVMDIVYKVTSDKPTVNVRALAFENGTRSFHSVVRPETFIEGTDANIGDGIAANVEHRLSWKVDKDWKTDLAKVKFEILTSDMAQLPLKTMAIPATAKNPAMTVATGTYTDVDIFNAMLWHYADGVDDLVLNNGYVDATYGYPNQEDTTPRRLVDRTTLPNRMEPLRYVLNKMGWEPLEGGNLLNYVRNATRKDLWYNSETQNAAILKSAKPANLYIGEKAYCVIDVSGGPSATSYPVSYLDTEPVNGWGDEYKTTKILLRRVEACRFMMQKTKEVTLTKPYYMGVFTITQKQYEQVMGSNPTQADRQGPMRPVEISWNAIRGDSTIYDWPMVKAVDPGSFVGKLQVKTGMSFDLPTEAQWENACRAGTSSKYNNGGNDGSDYVIDGNVNKDLSLLGWPWNNQSVPVGMFLPNLWGFYDMHGNVGQWTLDCTGAWNNDPALNFVGPADGGDRVIRGYFKVNSNYNYATSFYRYGDAPTHYCLKGHDAYVHIGFRLSRTLTE